MRSPCWDCMNWMILSTNGMDRLLRFKRLDKREKKIGAG
jgi:hypothetical protein